MRAAARFNGPLIRPGWEQSFKDNRGGRGDRPRNAERLYSRLTAVSHSAMDDAEVRRILEESLRRLEADDAHLLEKI
jgi:hypothetical protein